jgi:CheY-like chemotaxis protein
MTARANGRSCAGVRVLVVEDETFIRDTIRRMLIALGSGEIREAGDGAEALEVLADGFHPDLAICDVRMEPMDGVAFLRTLRQLGDRVQADMPVIILTAMSDEATVHSTAGLRVAAYLLKPISRDRLGERVSEVVSRR